MTARRHSLSEQMAAAAARAQAALTTARVNRVLALLSDQTLAAVAVEQSGAQGEVVIESVDSPFVWDDERVQARVAELRQEGLEVEPRRMEASHAGMAFESWGIRVRF